MRTYGAHLKPRRPPLLMRDGWSWGAFLFGPLWLLGMRAWLPALLEIAALTIVVMLVPMQFWRPALFGLSLINGLMGLDMVAWSLDRRGYTLDHVILAPDHDAALLRLFAARPDLVDDPR